MKLKVRARILSACMVLSVLVTACGGTTENLDTESVNVEKENTEKYRILLKNTEFYRILIFYQTL